MGLNRFLWLAQYRSMAFLCLRFRHRLRQRLTETRHYSAAASLQHSLTASAASHILVAHGSFRPGPRAPAASRLSMRSRVTAGTQPPQPALRGRPRGGGGRGCFAAA